MSSHNELGCHSGLCQRLQAGGRRCPVLLQTQQDALLRGGGEEGVGRDIAVTELPVSVGTDGDVGAMASQLSKM